NPDVFDADTTPPGNVDAGLDGDHAAGRERLLVALGERRALVDPHADPMAQRVPERLAVAGPLDHVARQRVRFAAGQPRLETSLGRFERAEHDRVDLPKAGVRFAHPDGAGEIGAVAVDAGAHVDHDGL